MARMKDNQPLMHDSPYPVAGSSAAAENERLGAELAGLERGVGRPQSMLQDVAVLAEQLR